MIEPDRLIRSKRKTIALIVERDGSLTVRAPKRAALRDIENFIAEKTAWIEKIRLKQKQDAQIPKKEYVEGEIYLYLGVEYPLRIVKSQRPALKLNHEFTLAQAFQPRGKAAFERWYKEQAIKVITERVEFYAAHFGFKPKRVGITSAKTRWGSCSSTGSLSFSWRLIMAPLDVVDYVILHELAHLRVKNHSQKFWALVEKLCPEFKLRRKWLKDHGERLTL